MICERESSLDPLSDVKKKSDYLSSIQCSSLYQVKPPSALDTYGAVFDHYANEGSIALGIFRERIGNHNEREMNYVYTNPSKDASLFASDKVFVLSPKIIHNKNMATSVSPFIA